MDNHRMSVAAAMCLATLNASMSQPADWSAFDRAHPSDVLKMFYFQAAWNRLVIDRVMASARRTKRSAWTLSN